MRKEEELTVECWVRVRRTCARPHAHPQVKKLQEDADGHKAAATEFAKGLETLSRGNLADVQKELMDTVRRMAVVQVRTLTA